MKEQYFCPRCYTNRDMDVSPKMAHCPVCKGSYFKEDLIGKVK